MVSIIALIAGIITILLGLLWLYAVLASKKLLKILAWINAVSYLLYGFVSIIIVILSTYQ